MELSPTPSIACQNQGLTISSQALLLPSLQESPHKGRGGVMFFRCIARRPHQKPSLCNPESLNPAQPKLRSWPTLAWKQESKARVLTLVSGSEQILSNQKIPEQLSKAAIWTCEGCHPQILHSSHVCLCTDFTLCPLPLPLHPFPPSAFSSSSPQLCHLRSPIFPPPHV